MVEITLDGERKPYALTGPRSILESFREKLRKRCGEHVTDATDGDAYKVEFSYLSEPIQPASERSMPMVNTASPLYVSMNVKDLWREIDEVARKLGGDPCAQHV